MTFFGLTNEIIPQYRRNLFSQIHEIVFYGNGGYDWGTVYSLSIPLRRFIYEEITKHYQSQNKSSTPQDPNKQTVVNSDGTINKAKAAQLKVPKYK